MAPLPSSWPPALVERIVRSSTDGILAFDTSCRYTLWNPSMERISGVRAEDVVGRNAFELFPFLVETGEDACFREALAGREAVSTDRPYTIPMTGREGFFEGRYSPLHDADGAIIGGLGVIRDVTERKRAEEARLEEARVEAARGATASALQRFAFLAGIGEVLASSLDLERTLAELTRLAVPLLGDLCIVDLVEGDQVRRVATSHVDPQRGALLAEMRARYPVGTQSPNPAGRVLASGRAELLAVVGEGELDTHTTDAGHADFVRRIGVRSILAVPLGVHGRALGVLTLAVSESDRRYGNDDLTFAEEVARRAALAIENARLYGALQLSEERFRAVVEQSPLSTQILSPDGFTSSVNRAWQELWGIPADRIADYNMLEDPQLETQGVAPFIRRAFAGEAVEIPAIRYDVNETLPDRSVHPNPVRWVRAFAYPIKDDGGRVRQVVLVHEDVSTRVEAEMRLREEDRRKDEFLATLAHELRNPLAPLRTGLDILRHGDRASSEATRAVMDRQLTHMVRLLDDLLDVSRIRNGKIELHVEPVAAARLRDAALELSSPALQAAGIEVGVAVDDALTLTGDPTRLAQVVSNLLNNAAKYTRAGGHVTLSMRRLGPKEVEIVVADDGIGIPAGMLDRVFDMFSQVRSDGSGLGVGLTLARRLVELHGGRIWAESEGEGRGTRIVVRLPSPDTAAVTPAAPAPRPRTDPPRKKRVLVVDDNVDGAEMLGVVLELDGHEVLIANDGETALELARTKCPDVAFLDIGMPGMDGYELARRLRALPELAGIVLVAVTGWGQEDDRRRSREAGFDQHLTKPVGTDAVKALLDGISPPAR